MAEMQSPADQLVQIVKETILDGYDVIRKVCPVKSTYVQKDIEYVQRRYDSEGIEFLTTTLPQLGEWFDEVILKERDCEVPMGFRPCGLLEPTAELRVAQVPLFLFPFWRFLYRNRDADDSFTLIRIIRTILYGLKKLELPFREEQVAQKLQTFLDIEEELSSFVVDWTDPTVQGAQKLLDSLFANWTKQGRPKHGPGAVAGGEKGAEKWNFSTYWRSVHDVFPAYELWPIRSNSRVRRQRLLPADPAWGDEWSFPCYEENRTTSSRQQLAAFAGQYRALKWEDAPVARLLWVPKDSRGPRIISCEPKELMYLQQGVCSAMVAHIEQHPLTKGHVNFADQEVNGALALEGSSTREWATIDLSDASDRVSRQLVEYLFPRGISRMLLALRSTSTQLPDGRKVHLNKYAPMGSALCFPVESVVFWALCVAVIREDTGDLTYALDSVYVYGDDIVVRDKHAAACIRALESCSLRVNVAKSLMGEHGFRESCGVDAFKGKNVTPNRIRKLPPRGPQDGTALVAYTKYAENSLYSVRRSRRCAEVAERHVGPIPRTTCSQSYLHIVDPDNSWDLNRYPDAIWDAERSYYRARLWAIRTKSEAQELDPWCGLTRSLVELGARDAVRVVTNPVTLIRKKMCDLTHISYVGRDENTL